MGCDKARKGTRSSLCRKALVGSGGGECDPPEITTTLKGLTLRFPYLLFISSCGRTMASTFLSAFFVRLFVFVYLVVPTTVLLLFREPEIVDVTGEQLLLPSWALIAVCSFLLHRRYGWGTGVAPFLAALIGALKYRADGTVGGLWRPPPGTDLSGKVAVITGGNSGLGLALAKLMAELGARVVITCRSESKCRRAAEEIDAAAWRGKGGRTESGGARARVPLPGPAFCALLDLSSLRSARDAAKRIATDHRAIHFLFASAGSTPRYDLTEDGYEDGFGGMHLGHAAFALGLLPSLRRGGAEETGDDATDSFGSRPARVVMVSSAAGMSSACDHLRSGSGKDVSNAGFHPSFADDRDSGEGDLRGEITRGNGEMMPSLPAYGRAKLCNILFAVELNRRCRERGWPVVAHSLHTGPAASKSSSRGIGSMFMGIPGLPFVTSQIWMPLLWRSPEEGAQLLLFAALSDDPPSMREGGQYLNGVHRPLTREGWPSRMGCLERAEEKWADRLWSVSLRLLRESPARNVVKNSP
uniref:Protochlorophyllide reductase n=1 Tax=Odontella aurita TaxID=265563 RepID=A0A7S4JYM5_9STRA|mmetsp:Transcript_57206/g.170552  ORF Transcript_57206/g.170552 Transcript_57206/m.170552 type:complete len:528 (+) Transcript_57206:496-2079(+)